MLPIFGLLIKWRLTFRSLARWITGPADAWLGHRIWERRLLVMRGKFAGAGSVCDILSSDSIDSLPCTFDF